MSYITIALYSYSTAILGLALLHKLIAVSGIGCVKLEKCRLGQGGSL